MSDSGMRAKQGESLSASLSAELKGAGENVGVECFACGGIVGTHLAPYGVQVLDRHPALFTDGFDCEGSNRAPQ